MNVRIREIPTNIVDLYDAVAKELGYNPDKCEYDCKKIEVSADIVEAIESQYEYQYAFTMEWICWGPKQNDDLPKQTVKVYKGFIKE